MVQRNKGLYDAKRKEDSKVWNNDIMSVELVLI